MTTKDLMQRLGLGYRSATELMRSSGFPSIQVGKKFVVDEQAYEKWYRLNQGRQVIRQPVSTPMIKCKRGCGYFFRLFRQPNPNFVDIPTDSSPRATS